MNRIFPGGLLAIALGLAAPAQTTAPPNPDCFPSPKLIQNAVNRLVDEMARQYNLDIDQAEQTRQIFSEAFPAWFEQNRGAVMQLVNEYLEAVTDNHPPSAQDASDWAARALPLVNEFAGMMRGSTDQMRGFLNDDQTMMLDSEMSVFNVSMGFVNQTLARWNDGGYRPEIEWPGSPDFEHYADNREAEIDAAIADARGEAPKAAEGQPARQAKPAPAAAKDEWTIYVENFVARYKLNEDQQNSAKQALRQAFSERDSYLSRKSEELDRVARQLQNAKTPEQRDSVRKAYEKLNEPIEGQFARLKEKLDKLPTRAQRAAAASDSGDTKVTADGAARRPARVISRNVDAAEAKPSGATKP